MGFLNSGLGRNRSGATAFEFAVLAGPFLLFLLFLFELGLDFYTQLALDYTVQEGARQLQTGAGNSAASPSAFITDCVCPTVSSLLNCSQLSVTVYPLATTDYYLAVKGGAGAIPLSGSTLNTSSWTFSTGGASTPMFIQAIYPSVSVVGQLLPEMSVSTANGRAHVATSSLGYVNEPFTSKSTVCGVTVS